MDMRIENSHKTTTILPKPMFKYIIQNKINIVRAVSNNELCPFNT